MQSTIPEILPNIPKNYYLSVGIAATVATIVYLSQCPNLNAIPTVGCSGWLGSWWAAIKFISNARDVIREGYRKHNGAPFKVATLSRWVVVVASRAHVEELRSARDDVLSSFDAMNEDFNFEFTMGSELTLNPWHFDVIRSQLPRKVGAVYSDMREELMVAFDAVLGLENNEWKSVPALATIRQIVCRASNRSFVGLPLCRDQDYIDLNIQITIDTFIRGCAIGFFPKLLKPLAAYFITNARRNSNRAAGYLRPIIEERRKYLKEYGKEWAEKPDDLLSWLMDEVPDATVEALTWRILSTDLVAIHTSANVFTNALYNLAANPQYAQPLRDEVEAIVEKDGWSKASVSKMRKVDSFLRESIRMESPVILGLPRKAVNNFTFSDGTFIPKGTRINAGLIGIHFDEVLYEHPEEFDPFRFTITGNEDEEDCQRRFVTTSPEYLAFGHGQHACPGRFFVAATLKTMLAHIVTTYDVKLEETARPQGMHFGGFLGANPTARIVFRMRAHRTAMQTQY